ncbi:MAG TPA: hypothetical protein HPQ03_10025 [Deltaproteobacteria bacterium]|nr:hypothetical protein [Deltaproteobacteria bacterium]
MKFSFKFWVGIILLTTNQPLGWGTMFIFNALSVNKQDALYSFLGIGAYALSWGMLGLGLLMVGPEGIKYSRTMLKKLWGFFAYRFY